MMSDWDDPATMAVTTYPPVVTPEPIRYAKLYKVLALICFGILIGHLIGCSEQRASPCAGRPDSHVETYKNEFAPGKPTGEICVPNKKADQ